MIRGEGLGAAARPVVGDDPHEPGDAVGDGEGPGTAEEADRGGGLLVVEGLGVGQTGEAVDGGVQVGVADPGSFASFGGFGFGGSSPVGPPASLRWDASNLLDVQVDHIARRAGQDRFAGIVGLPSRTGYRLGGHTGDRTTCLDTHHEPVAVLRRQHSVTVGHNSGAFPCRKDDSAPPIHIARGPAAPRHPGATIS